MNDDELIVDSFAGGGGASLGIAWALGRAPDIAINHDPSDMRWMWVLPKGAVLPFNLQGTCPERLES